jgi:hypothetical protein
MIDTIFLMISAGRWQKNRSELWCFSYHMVHTASKLGWWWSFINMQVRKITDRFWNACTCIVDDNIVGKKQKIHGRISVNYSLFSTICKSPELVLLLIQSDTFVLVTKTKFLVQKQCAGLSVNWLYVISQEWQFPVFCSQNYYPSGLHVLRMHAYADVAGVYIIIETPFFLSGV